MYLGSDAIPLGLQDVMDQMAYLRTLIQAAQDDPERLAQLQDSYRKWDKVRQVMVLGITSPTELVGLVATAINAASDALISTVQDTAAVVGQTAGAITKPLVPVLWPIALGAIAIAAILFWPQRRGPQ